MINKIFSTQDLGLQLRAQRKALGRTQQQMATLIGISRPTVIALEKGEPVSTLVLMKFLTGLGKTLVIQDSRIELEQLDAFFADDQ